MAGFSPEAVTGFTPEWAGASIPESMAELDRNMHSAANPAGGGAIATEVAPAGAFYDIVIPAKGGMQFDESRRGPPLLQGALLRPWPRLEPLLQRIVPAGFYPVLTDGFKKLATFIS